MKYTTLFVIVSLSTGLASCASVELATLPDKSPEALKTAHLVLKDEAYGPDTEQKFDIYISNNLNELKNNNFTIIFLHGGGYYLSDKSSETQYIEPYLKKGMNVVNVNYRLKRGIPAATEDLTRVLHFLKAHNDKYHLNLNKIVLTGFSAGGHISSNVGAGANNDNYPFPLGKGFKIVAVINFSGPVAGLALVEKGFIDHEMPLYKEVGNALFPSISAYTPNDTLVKYEPITYFDQKDPAFFLWHGGKDNQIPPATFVEFVARLNENQQKNTVVFVPDGSHAPNKKELAAAYARIFVFLDKLKYIK